MDKREWKKEALWYYLRMKEWMDSPYRRNREYARYLKRFFFGDGEISFNNPKFHERMDSRELPMPTNIYLMG